METKEWTQGPSMKNKREFHGCVSFEGKINVKSKYLQRFTIMKGRPQNIHSSCSFEGKAHPANMDGLTQS